VCLHTSRRAKKEKEREVTWEIERYIDREREREREIEREREKGKKKKKETV